MYVVSLYGKTEGTTPQLLPFTLLIEIAKHCETISIYALTCLIAQRKKRLKYLGKRRKQKIKQYNTYSINKLFNENQSRVFNKFKEQIDEDKDNLQPEYDEKKSQKEQKHFENQNDVETFWRNLWEAEDKGNPQAEWLTTFREMFREMIPDTDVEVTFSEKDSFDNIKKKKNWSAPGPDRIVNFWWKKLEVTKYVHPIYLKTIQESVPLSNWFCRGRTVLIPKDGEWAISNHRPITCLNNMYKWYTSIIKMKSNEHLKRYKLMQVDQRGACEEVSGTSDNLMIDDMVLRDAILHKRNLFTTWIDVKKAFDSVSHSFLIEILKIHRFPDKIVYAVKNIIETWNIVLVIQLEDGPVESTPIELTNGELQGDTYCPDLYTLCNNLVSWVARSTDGYILSKPIKKKVTHTLFIDDMKNYWASIIAGIVGMSLIKACMKDCGLDWNEKKCKGCLMIRGKFVEHEDVLLDDGSKIECLKVNETYKFMGVYESIRIDKDGLEISLMKKVEQRTHIIWKSNLYDINKVTATNMFVHGCVEYYFWGCNMRIDFLQQLDRCIRRVMNKCGAKHTNMLNAGVYLSRCKGGRGLKSLECSYKDIKIKSAMKLKVNTDPRMQLVNQFHQVHLDTNSYSLFKEAARYCEEKELDFQCEIDFLEVSGNSVKVSSENEKCNEQLKLLLKTTNEMKNLQEILNSKWQGVILKTIIEDETVLTGNLNWLTKWRSCPSSTITEMMNLLYQTLSTLCYKKHCIPEGTELDTSCRLCRSGQESVKHLLSNCNELAKHVYTQRHNNALKCFFFPMLKQFGFIDEIPPWCSSKTIQPEYENDEYLVHWDVPEYSGKDGETIKDSARPDGKLIMKKEKKVFLIEQTVPWITNRDTKYELKKEKYLEVQSYLRLEYPGFHIDQVTLVVDVFGGYSKNLRENVGKVLSKEETNNVITNMQKSVIASEAHLCRVFKVRTM